VVAVPFNGGSVGDGRFADPGAKCGDCAVHLHPFLKLHKSFGIEG
jgi:hypothetical protein